MAHASAETIASRDNTYSRKNLRTLSRLKYNISGISKDKINAAIVQGETHAITYIEDLIKKGICPNLDGFKNKQNKRKAAIIKGNIVEGVTKGKSIQEIYLRCSPFMRSLHKDKRLKETELQTLFHQYFYYEVIESTDLSEYIVSNDGDEYVDGDKYVIMKGGNHYHWLLPGSVLTDVVSAQIAEEGTTKDRVKISKISTMRPSITTSI
ncbi:MAG: hypothetical protein OEY79_01930 [Anaplasmataceae bacterium]|nr:hypothetical protein [Anaplasmataceae bacterium]